MDHTSPERDRPSSSTAGQSRRARPADDHDTGAAPTGRGTGEAVASADLNTLVDGAAATALIGGVHSVEKLLTLLRPWIERYCRARLGPRLRRRPSGHDIDLPQEVCLAVLAALPAHREPGSPFLAFVHRIAANKLADAYRAMARNRVDPWPGSLRDARAEQVPEAEPAVRIRRLVDALPEQQREILVLRVVMGMSTQETADVIGLPAGAVRVAQSRALTGLREALARD